MADSPASRHSDCIIEFADAATLDLASIDNATDSMWGHNQADMYIEFLQGVIFDLAQHPALGRDAAQFPGVKTYVAKSRHRRSAHGYRIVYRSIGNGIRIIRILHTAMQWQDHLMNE